MTPIDPSYSDRKRLAARVIRRTDNRRSRGFEDPHAELSGVQSQLIHRSQELLASFLMPVQSFFDKPLRALVAVLSSSVVPSDSVWQVVQTFNFNIPGFDSKVIRARKTLSQILALWIKMALCPELRAA